MRVATSPTSRRQTNELGSSPLHVHAGRCEEQHQSPCRCQGQQSQGCGLTGREADSETTSESGLALQVRRSESFVQCVQEDSGREDFALCVCWFSKSPEINRAVGCVCHPSKTPEINGAVGRCPSKISGTWRVLDKQPSRAPGRAWGWFGSFACRRFVPPELHVCLSVPIFLGGRTTEEMPWIYC